MQLVPWRRLFALTMILVVLFATPASAANEHTQGQAGQAEHGEKGKLDFTGLKRWDLGIYTLVVFGLLVLIVAKYAWPKISEGLEKRESSIRSALDEARKDRTDAADLLARAKKELDETAARVKAMLDEARREGEALRASEREAGEKDAQAERDRARREATAEKEANLKEVQQQAVELAILIATKALRQQVAIENQRQLLDESIAELKGSAGATRA